MLANPASPTGSHGRHVLKYIAGWYPGGELAGTDGLLGPDPLSSDWLLLTDSQTGKFSQIPAWLMLRYLPGGWEVFVLPGLVAGLRKHNPRPMCQVVDVITASSKCPTSVDVTTRPLRLAILDSPLLIPVSKQSPSPVNCSF